MLLTSLNVLDHLSKYHCQSFQRSKHHCHHLKLALLGRRQHYWASIHLWILLASGDRNPLLVTSLKQNETQLTIAHMVSMRMILMLSQPSSCHTESIWSLHEWFWKYSSCELSLLYLRWWWGSYHCLSHPPSPTAKHVQFSSNSSGRKKLNKFNIKECALSSTNHFTAKILYCSHYWYHYFTTAAATTIQV